MSSRRSPKEEGGVGLAERPKDEVRKPRMFKVLIHNDHFTSQEFVTEILNAVFRHPVERAYQIMLQVHRNGIGIAGVYTKEIAETKIATVHRMAESEGYPLRLTMEPESDDQGQG